jgi:hypothetical protein
LSQGSGNSVISGPSPSVTDSDGQIQFTAADQQPETVTYSATDVTDGNLPFPETGTVQFVNGPANGCGNSSPTSAPGFLVNTYANGFLASNYFYGDINVSGCPGAIAVAFDSSGNLFVSDSPTGNIYKIPPGGGSAAASTLVTATPIGPTLGNLVFDASGNLYGGRSATTGNFTTGAVLQIDPSTGAVIREVASNLTCASFIAIDPLSGDLFATDSCTGAGADNSALWRISNPSGVSPTVSVYANLPATPNATISFTPNGTIYVWSDGNVSQVTGTNGPVPPVVTTVSGVTMENLGLFAQGDQANGDAQFLTLGLPAVGSLPAMTGQVDLGTSPPSPGVSLFNGSAEVLRPGPDGCIYAAQGVGVFKITDANGGCNYAAAIPTASLSLSPSIVDPNPAQGSSQTLTASFHYVTVPTGTPVTFQIAGANPQVQQVTASSSGQATFTYTAIHQGVDTITATATVGAASLSSNPAVITWGTGMDVTSLTLNQSATGAAPNQTVNLVASLVDVSQTPITALAGQEISFSAAGESCGASTNAQGVATCQITPTTPGISALTASFAGTAQYVASNASTGFNVVAPPTTVPTPTATPTPSAACLEASTAALEFPARAAARGRVTRNFRIRNTCGAAVTGYVTPLNDTAFFVIRGGGNFSLGAGESRKIVVAFRPPQTGAFQSNVLIVGEQPSYQQVIVDLSGTGTPRPK